MSHSRKHVTDKTLNSDITVGEGHTVVKVVSIRGGNICEVQKPNGEQTLTIIPAKFNKILWIKNGSYAIIDKEDDDPKSKIRSSIVNILSKDNIKELKKSNQWPIEFEDQVDTNKRTQIVKQKVVKNDDDSDDDSLSDLMENPNHKKHAFIDDTDSDEDDDEEDDE
ncbi:hypothetical protein CYY_007864 [Polysphondylium violaceum]|uniref:S1-like domain-containing protein n=1 Tax=Polysphondylium violaceum TaxID=133409 RepID=A0A8J4V1V0_9MYCE|nr:hypothetical protein CYY_007864 [Polysphondylium violaceum]